MLTEVCHNVATEPSLQPISAETFPNATANTSDDARLDVKARSFWCRGQDAYFDVHSVSLLRTSAMRMPRNVSMVNVLERLNMESLLHWCVPPLVVWVGRPLSFTRDLLIYLRLTGDNHTALPSTGCDVVCPLHCFDQLFCIRGSRSSVHRPVKEPLDLSMVLVESRLTD